MSSIEPDRGSSEINGGEKVSGGLVITGRQRPKLFELTEEIFDQMACFVKLTVVRASLFTVGPGRNHRRFSGLLQGLEHPLVGVVTLIDNDDRRCNRRQQFIGSVQVAGLSGRQQKASRVTERIDGSMDLGAQPALAASQGLVLALFFGAPALCW